MKDEKIYKWIIIGGIMLAILCFWVGCDRLGGLKNKLDIADQNMKALTDSVRYEKNKNGDLEASINIFVSDKKNLENLNKELALELAKEQGKVYELNKFLATIRHDTVYINNTLIEYPNGDYGLKFVYDTSYNANNSRRIEGTSKFRIDSTVITPLMTEISADIIRFDLVTGLRKKDGNIEIFARSDYPNLLITDMKGAIIDPKNHPVIKDFFKPKRIGIGPYLGFGFSDKLKPSVQLGIGIQYSLIRL